MPEGPAEPEEDPSLVQVPEEADWDASEESDSARREVRLQAEDRPSGSAAQRGRSPRRRRDGPELLSAAPKSHVPRRESSEGKGSWKGSYKGSERAPSKGSKGGGSKKGKQKGKSTYELRDVQRLVSQAVKEALREERKKTEHAPGWYPTHGDQWYYWDGWRWCDEEWSAAATPPPPPPPPHETPRPPQRSKGIECATCGRDLPPGDEMCRVCDLMRRRVPKEGRPRAEAGRKERSARGRPEDKRRGDGRETERQPGKKQKAEPPPSSSDSCTYEEEGPEESRPTDDPEVSVSHREERQAKHAKDRQRPENRQRPDARPRPAEKEKRATIGERKKVKEEPPEPSDGDSGWDGASTARTSELRELLQRQAEKKPGDRSKPSLSQVRIETFKGSRTHYTRTGNASSRPSGPSIGWMTRRWPC